MDRQLLYNLILSTFPVICQASKESYTAEYFTNVSLPCNYTLHNFSYPLVPVPFKRYWVLPNGTVLPDTFLGDWKFRIGRLEPDFRLYVAAIDDPDFGWYHCVLLWNNWDYMVDTIRIGLNEDGPYYEKLLRELEKRLIIGSVCAGAFFLICMFGCWFWNYKSKKKKNREFTYIHSERSSTKYPYEEKEEERSGERLGTRPANMREMYAKVDKRGHDNPSMKRSSNEHDDSRMHRSSHGPDVRSAKL